MLVSAETGAAVHTGFGRQVAVVSVLPWVAVLVADQLGIATNLGLFAALAVVGTMHVGTTAAVYLDPAFRPLLGHDPRRYLLAPVALVALGVAAAWWLPAALFAVLVAVRVLWQIHHFNRQNLGMLAMRYKATGEEGLSSLERRALDVAGWGAIVGVLATTPDWLPAVANVVTPLRGALLGAGLALLAAGAVLVVRSGRWTTGLAVLYWLPLFVFHDRPAVALLAIGLTHAAQYYLMMLGLRGGRSSQGARTVVLAVATTAATVGLFHANAFPFAHDTTSGVGYGLFFGVGAAHFVIDAGMWKMRDAKQRAYLKDRFAFL